MDLFPKPQPEPWLNSTYFHVSCVSDVNSSPEIWTRVEFIKLLLKTTIINSDEMACCPTIRLGGVSI